MRKGRKRCLVSFDLKNVAIQSLLASEEYEVISKKINNADSCLDAILSLEPEIVFVDIDQVAIDELVYKTFRYLEQVPKFIVTSRETKKAYDCIKLGVFDYLLYPLQEKEVRKCFFKLQKVTQSIPSSPICLKSYSDYYFIDPEDILYLQADNNNTDIYLTSGKRISAFKTLKYFEEQMPMNFLRVHNSYIINSDKVLRINYGKSQIYLKKKAEMESIPFSRSYREKVDALREVLAKHHIRFS